MNFVTVFLKTCEISKPVFAFIRINQILEFRAVSFVLSQGIWSDKQARNMNTRMRKIAWASPATIRTQILNKQYLKAGNVRQTQVHFKKIRKLRSRFLSRWRCHLKLKHPHCLHLVITDLQPCLKAERIIQVDLPESICDEDEATPAAPYGNTVNSKKDKSFTQGFIPAEAIRSNNSYADVVRPKRSSIFLITCYSPSPQWTRLITRLRP